MRGVKGITVKNKEVLSMSISLINKSILLLALMLLVVCLYSACSNAVKDYNTAVNDVETTTETATEAVTKTLEYIGNQTIEVIGDSESGESEIVYRGNGYDYNTALNYDNKNYVFIKTLDELDSEAIKEYEYLGMVDKFEPECYMPQEEFSANFLGEAFPIYDYGENAREIAAYYEGKYNLFVKYEVVTGGVSKIRYDKLFYYITCLEDMNEDMAKEYTYLGEVNRVVSPSELLTKPFSTNMMWIDFPIYQYNDDCTEIIAVYEGKVYLFASIEFFRDENYREKYGVVMC